MALEEITFLSDYYIFSTYKFKTQNEDNKDSTIEKALKSIRDKAFGYITESLDLVAMTDATKEIIVDEINQQNDTNLPNEAIYQELARLLADLYRIDEDLINDVISDIIETLNMNGSDMDILIDILDSDNANDIDQVLSSLIEQYYNIKKDEKKYEK